MEFNYALILGNSGTGKTTLAKTVVADLKSQGFKVLVFDPNRQWSDLCDQEVGPEELGYGLNRIAKPLLWQRQKAILVIEDLGFTLLQLSQALNINMAKAKNMIRLILENARKYQLKVMVITHRISSDEVDTVTFQQFDAYAIFFTALTGYGSKLIKQRLSIDAKDILGLENYHYIAYNGGHIEHGTVSPLPSHMAIEGDQNFQVRYMLKKYETNGEKVCILKVHLGFSHVQTAKILGLTYEQVKSYCTMLRKRGVSIPDERRKNYANLIF